MKVSSKGHYGLLALAELVDNYKLAARRPGERDRQNQQMPLQYLGQIMVLLKRGHLVHAARGPTGGYMLARPPESITVKEIVAGVGRAGGGSGTQRRKCTAVRCPESPSA